MAGAFEADLTKFMEHFDGNIDKTLQYSVVLTSQGVVMNSPVLTGRLRGNWQFGRNSPPSGTLATLDTSGAAAIARIAGQVTSLKAGGDVWVVNNLPYAKRVEYGYSAKAPQGMVRKTLANLPAAIESFVQGL
jgi:hypothetical protein